MSSAKIKKYYVYKTIHCITGEYYIGKRTVRNPYNDNNYFGSGVWIKSIQDKSVLKKSIISIFDTFEEASDIEFNVIKDNIFNPLCKNIRVVSGKGRSGITTPKETIIKLSGVNNHNFGKAMSVESKLKLSIAKSGENHHNYGKTGEDSPTYGKCGEQSATSVLNDELVREIKIKLKLGVSGVSLAEKYNVSPSTISYIKLGKSWSHVII